MILNTTQTKHLLIGVALAFVIVYIDITILSVALPTIRSFFHTSSAHALWVVNIYALSRATLVFASGRISDVVSHIKTFVMGLLLFLVASLICAISPHINTLIAGRCLQGIGATFIFTAGMSAVTSTISKEKRGRIIGSLLSLSLLSMAIAPIVGGLIIRYLSWPWIFYINLFIGGVSLLLISPLYRLSAPTTHKSRLDWWGFLFISVFVLASNIAFQNAIGWGFESPLFYILCIAAILALVTFIKIELTVKSPLVDLQLFLQPFFTAGCVIAALTQVSTWLILFLGLLLQYGLHYTAWEAGYLLTPLLAVGLLSANLGGWLVDHYGVKPPLVIGTGALLTGLICTLCLFQHLTYARLLPLLILGGLGIFMVNGPIRATLLNHSPKHQYGMVNATLTGLRGIMSAIGFAALSSVLSRVERNQINTQLKQIVPHLSSYSHQTLERLVSHTQTSQHLLDGFSTKTQNLIQHIILHAYLSGFFWMLVLLTILIFIAFLASVYAIHSNYHGTRPA